MKPIWAPNYWADGSALATALARASQFQGFLNDQEISGVAKSYYRELVAISRTWRKELLDSDLWKLQLQGSETVEGLEGPAAEQPIFDEPASASRFQGGGIQVYLYPKTPFLCTPVSWEAVS